MKKQIMNVMLIAASAVMFLSGCMSDKEYTLRKKQFENQAKHPTTFDVATISGPVKVEIGEGGVVRVTAPNQPFKEIHIPDGMKTQAELIQHLVDIGAITVIGWKALDEAKGNTKTINNNAAPAAGE